MAPQYWGYALSFWTFFPISRAETTEDIHKNCGNDQTNL